MDERVVSFHRRGATVTHGSDGHLKQGLGKDSSRSVWSQEVELEQWEKWLLSVQVGACRRLQNRLCCFSSSWFPVREDGSLTGSELSTLRMRRTCPLSFPHALWVELMLSWMGMRKMCLPGLSLVACGWSGFILPSIQNPYPSLRESIIECHLFAFTCFYQVVTLFSTQMKLISVPICAHNLRMSLVRILVWLSSQRSDSSDSSRRTMHCVLM